MVGSRSSCFVLAEPSDPSALPASLYGSVMQLWLSGIFWHSALKLDPLFLLVN